MAKSLVVGVGGIVLGAAVGFALGMTLGAAPVDEPAGARDAAAADGRPADAAPAPERESSGSVPERRHVRAAPASAAELLQAVDIGPVPRGDGIITGHVRLHDSHGAGVGGVEITLQPRAPEEWNAAYDDASIEERVALYARGLRWTEAAKRTAISASDGAYELTGVPDCELFVVAKHDSYSMRRTTATTIEVAPGAVIDFAATPLTRATILVRGPGGTEPENVQVRLVSNGGRRKTSVRAGRRPQNVRPGTFTLTAEGGAFGELCAERSEVTFEEGRTDHEVVIELRPVPGIGGSISFENPEEHVSLQVFLQRVTDGAAPPPGRLAQSSRSGRVSSRGGESLTYSFPGLSPGTYAVGVARQNELPAEVHMVDVNGDFVRSDLVLPDRDRADCVEIAAYAPDGSPVTDISATLHWERENGRSSSGARPVRRPDGSLWVPIPPNYDRDTGTHRIELRSQEYGSVSREFTPGPGARIEVRFAPPATLRVEIAGYRGSAAEGRVQVFVGDAARPWGRGQEPDAEGCVTLGPLAPGACEIVVRPSDRFGRGQALVTRSATLVSGDNPVTVALPALHKLTVELSGTVGDRMVGLRLEGGRVRPVRPDEDGRVVFDLLPAGEYTIQVYNGEGGSKTVQVPGTSLVRF